MFPLFRVSGLSIRSILTGVFSAMALLLVASSGYSLWQGWQAYQRARHVESVSSVDKLIFEAMQALRNDRSVLNRALLGAEPGDAEVRENIEAERAASAPLLAAALEAIAQADVPDQEQWLSRLRSGAAAFERRREQAVAEFQVPTARRDDAVREDYYEGAAAFVSEMGAASGAFAGSIRLVDPVIDQLLVARQLSWTLRDTESQFRRKIEDALIAGTLAAEDREEAMELRGRMDTAWEALNSALDAGDTPAELRAGIAEIKRAYFADFAPRRDATFAALVAGQVPTMTGKEWRDLSKGPSEYLKGFVPLVAKVAVQHATERTAELRGNLLLNAALVVVALGLCGIGLYVVSRRVVQPVSHLTWAMSALAEGNVAVEIPAADHQDEIGAMAAAVRVFKDNAVARQRLEAEQQAEMAAKQRRAQAVEELISGFDAQIKDVLNTVTSAASQLNSTAQSMSTAAADSTAKATTVAAASEQASANVKTVAGATDELAKSTSEIGRQVTTSQNIARQAVREAERTNGTVAGLVETAARVGEVVELINSIAAQTNLLALNATIEAARAGEAGKGFAVVASEVKSLANQTAKATEQIAQQIQAMQSVSGDAASAIKDIGGTILRIDEIATSVAAAVEEQNAATAEIARNVQEAARGTEEVSGNIVQVNDAASRTGASADQVLTAAQELTRQAEAMRGMVFKFLAEMRAA